MYRNLSSDEEVVTGHVLRNFVAVLARYFHTDFNGIVVMQCHFISS